MHCTWFNEKKKVHFPHIYFLWVFFFSVCFSLLIRPHISCGPRRLSPEPHSDTRERSDPHPCLPRSPAGRAPCRPSWPAASDLARAGAPQTPAPVAPAAPIVSEGTCGRAGGPFRSPLSSDPV